MKRISFTACVLLAAIIVLPQCGKKSNPMDDGGGDGTPIAPRITAAYPADSSAGLPHNTLIYVTFDRAMDHAATEGALTVAGMTGVKSWSNYILAFRPDSSFPAGDTVRYVISTAAKDNAGTPLAAAASYSFVCGATADATPPTVASHSPSDTGVAVDAAVIAHCSEKLAPWSDAAISLQDSAGGVAVGGSAGLVNDSILRFVPSALLPSTTYRATVGTACVDRCGNPMAAAFDWYFTTAADNVAPAVHGSSPANGDTLVSANAVVRIRFSEPMDTASVNAALAGTPTLHYGASWSADTMVTLTMTDTMSFHTAHQVTVGTGATDKAGNHLATAYSFTFTTARGLYVACTTGNSISLYQQNDLKAEGSILSSPSVRQIEMSPSGDRAYVLDNDGVKTLDLRNHNRIVDTIALSSNSYGLAISPNGLRLAVSDPAQNHVYLVAAATGQMQDTVTSGLAGAMPKGIVFSGDSRYLYVACSNRNYVLIYDLNYPGNPPVQITSAYECEEMAATPAGDIVFAACGPGVTAITTGTNLFRYNITVAGTPHPFGLAVSPDGQHLAVSWYNLSSVSIYNASTGAHITDANVGSNPEGLCYSPDGRYLYVANAGSGTVTPVARSGATYTPAAPVAAGAGPWGIAVTP